MISFREEGHIYKSLPSAPEQINWTSVTTIVELFCEEFDEQIVAHKCSIGLMGKNKPYRGMTVKAILDLWATENKRSTDLGSKYHLQKETQLIDSILVEREGLLYPVYPPIILNGEKLAIPQKLIPGVYAEHMMYLNSAGVCGQSDRVEIIDKYIDVYDHKTNKTLDFESYKNQMGKSKKMRGVLSHLDDCNYMHYTIQLSIYMYILRKHNYNLIPRNLVLEHVKFAVESKDKFGFPKYYTDLNGNPIIEDVTPYKVDYLEREVISIFNFIKENPEELAKFKLKRKLKHV